ncbi:MAG: polysaccharide biosynthesis transport protein [Planctomycetota bacterium]|nr:polysaccharide biosynthesis transport protein [Planctomycetota bacterium]
MRPYNGNENEEIHLLDYLKIIQKRKWVVIICFVVVVVFITIKTFKTTPVFQATSSIVLERKELNVGFQQVVTENQMAPMDFYTNQCEIIKSRAIAKKVIDVLDLKNHPEFNTQKKGESPDIAKDIPQDPFAETRFINGFLSKLNVSLMRNSGVVNIKYNGHNPQLTTKIANSIIKTYIEQNWERRYNVAKDALNWLNKQIKDVKIALEESEQALQKYKKANDLIAVDMGESAKSSTMAGERQNVVLQ